MNNAAYPVPADAVNGELRLFASVKMGLESTVAFALKKLNAKQILVSDARVDFSGDAKLLADCLLWLRTAERVFLQIGSFPAHSFDELFEGTRALPWKSYLPQNAAIHVNGKSARSQLFSVSDCQSIVKKAIVEKMKASYHTDVLPENGREIIVEVGMLRDRATIALDCCGAGLSRRGYRSYNVAAPLSETLAAGILDLSRYRGEQSLIDPMCGSGTIPIEAAMMAIRRAPGLGRSFAAENWTFIDQSVFRIAREEAEDAIDRSVRPEIYGFDIDERCVALCKIHAKKAGIMANWAVRPLADFQTPAANTGLLITNPPYGERLGSLGEAKKLYRQMHDCFDTSIPAWRVSIISGYPEFENAYGQRADKRRKLSNGGMQCYLYQYYRRAKGTWGDEPTEEGEN